MITITRTDPYRPVRSTNTNPVNRTQAVDELEVDQTTKSPVFDRRRHRDRRRRNQGNVLLDSRTGNDRRKNKNSRRPSIDIKA